VKEQWGKLTDDDLNVIDGRREQLEGKIQERYGYAKDQARKDIDDCYGSQRWGLSTDRRGQYHALDTRGFCFRRVRSRRLLRGWRANEHFTGRSGGGASRGPR